MHHIAGEAAPFQRSSCTTAPVTEHHPGRRIQFKAEAVRTWSNGKRIYQQSAAYVLMLNTGLRTCEVLGLLKDLISWLRNVPTKGQKK